MAKAVISNRIYIDNPGVDHTKLVMQELTYKIKKDTGSKQFQAIETIKNYKVLTKGIISLPQGRVDLIPNGYEIVDKRLYNPVPFPNPKFELRPDQQEIYDKVNDTCFINAKVGWGKTFTALHLARKFGQKTLFITHTTALRDQWIEEAELLFGTKVGIVGSQQFDIEDHFIVIGNIQTLAKKIPELSKEFGTVIMDEAHHCPATTFAETVDAFPARYRIALSGTMIRKDKKHILFKDYFGDHILKPEQANTMIPTIYTVKTGITLKPDATWVEKINDLMMNESYRKAIAAISLREMSKGHAVLLVASRVEFLARVKEYIGEDCLLVTGDTSFEDRKTAKEQLLSGEKHAIAGSRQIFSEGISINRLSCLILAEPMSNDSLLEQLIGRVQRMFENKLDPIVIDMQFAGRNDRKQNNDRMAFYLKQGWEILAM
jgi:superfamily II DNA or RNA helicase